MTARYPSTTHTQGTTYSRAGLYALPAGTWSATATVKKPDGTLVQALDVNLSALGSPDVDGNTHSLSLLATAAETATWPLQALLCDIIFTDASVTPVKVPAQTVQIVVSAHTPPLSDPDNPLQTISGDMAPVLRGATGPTGADSTVPGPPGDPGAPGADGAGVPAGGLTGYVLAKVSGTDYDTEWVPQTGGGGGAVDSVNGQTGVVVLSKTDVGLGSADNTADADKPVSTATQAALDGKASTSHNHTGVYDPAGTAASAVGAHEGEADPHPGYVLESTIGVAGGVTPLDGTGKVASAYLPAYVDDVLEYANAAALPGTGSAGVIYVTLDDNKTWRWGGSSYTEISPSPGTTDAVPEGSTNLYHTAARVLGQVLTGLSTAAGTVVTSAHTILQAIGFLQKQVSDNATAIGGKQATLVSGTNIKSVNGNSLLGSGDLTVGGSIAPLVITDANTVEQYNSTNAQKSHIYNTRTDASNYERGFMRFASNVLEIGTEKAGTGTNRDVRIITAAGKVLLGNGAIDCSSESIKILPYAGNANAYLSQSGGNAFLNGASAVYLYISGAPALKGTSSSFSFDIAAAYQSQTIRGWDHGSFDGNAPGSLTIRPGNATTKSSPTYIVGADLNLVGGAAATQASGAAHGGALNLAGGAGYGTGTKGAVNASRLNAAGFATAIVSKTANYTATADDSTIQVDATSGAITITLPAVSGAAGRIYVIKKTDASGNAVTVDPNASETIDGATTASLASQYSTITIQANAAGTAWHKLSGV